MRANMIAVLVAVMVLPSPAVLLVNNSVFGGSSDRANKIVHAQLVIDLGNHQMALVVGL